MPYLGNEPAEAYSNIAYQDFGTQSGTTFTLDFPAGAPGELEVFVNNVRQEPSVAYTVSGTTLTMTGTVAATDDFYVVFQGKAQQTVTHPANTALVATSGTFSGNLTVAGTSPGNLTGIQTFTANGTYTPTAGTTKVLVYVVGGGGGGGGVDGQGSTKSAAGGGGGGGGTAMKLITSGLGATEAITIGAGGTAGASSAGTGGTGGTSSFGSHCSATGGDGGIGGTAAVPSNANMRLGGAGGAGSSGDVNVTGETGKFSVIGGTSTSEACSGEGGGSMFGGGTRSVQGDAAGNDGIGHGAGGSGAVVTNLTSNYAGGAGHEGIVIVYEYQ